MNWKKPKIEHAQLTKYNWLVLHPEKLKLGKNTDIAAFTLINAHYGVEIQDNVSIGPHCVITSHNTTKYESKGKIVIGKGTHIGGFCTIMPGSTIKPNSIIRAYSYVDGKI